jgi:hypothetical protein
VTEVCDLVMDPCQGSGTGEVLPPASSPMLGTDGNVPRGVRAELAFGQIGAGARRAGARSGMLAVRVRLNRVGLVRVLVWARIGNRKRHVGRASKNLFKPGATTVLVKFNFVARKQLRRGRKLNLSIQVRSPGARPRTMTVRLPGASS